VDCVIEKNVPVPEHKNQYPMRYMAVGDSFVRSYGDYRSAYDSMRNLARYYGMKVVIRREGDMMRVWRTA
jgi:hypothetical protein